jgi:sugar phosphate permease
MDTGIPAPFASGLATGGTEMRSIRGGYEASPGYRWIIFWVLAAQFMFVYFHRVSTAVVAPDLVQSFHISGTALGLLSSGYFYTYASMQVPAGLLSDTWGPRRTIASFALIAGLGAVLFGLSGSFGMAVAGRILVGFGLSTLFVSSMKVFSLWFSGREYARISGIFLAVGGTGWLVAATPLAVLSRCYGWRTVFVAIGIITLFLGVLAWSVIIDNPAKRRAEAGRTSPPGGRRRLTKDIGTILGEKYFWPLAVWSFINGGIIFGFFGLWAGPYLMDVRGLPKTEAGNMLAMVALSMIVGSPGIGYLADKVIPSRKLLLLSFSVIQTLCWVFMFFCHAGIPHAWLYALFFIMGLTSVAAPVVLLTATKELFSNEITGTAQGVMNLFPFAASVVFQPLIGLILDKARTTGCAYRYEPVFQFLCAVSIVATISLCFAKGHRKMKE